MNPRRTLITVAAAGLLGGVGGAAIESQTGGTAGAASSGTAATATTSATPAAADGTAYTAGQIYQRSKDAVAFITAQVTQPAAGPSGQQQGASGTSTGTGFVIGSDGYIATNDHVVANASKVTVKVGDGRAKTAEVVGTDASTDVALLKIDTGGTSLPTLKLSDSSTAKVGDDVFAIGNPYGLDRTLTTGVVSALQRTITAPDGYSISNVIQTDAALNPGNSGGPLINTAGEVVGINSQIETANRSSDGSTGSNSGVGFAVPSNTVTRVIDQLKSSGKATHAFLGVALGDSNGGSGATVGTVSSGGPAADAGLRQGDVITAVGGKTVDGAETVTSAVDAAEPGDLLKLTVTRSGSERAVTVKLGTRPSGAAETSQEPQQPSAPTDPQALLVP